MKENIHIDTILYSDDCSETVSVGTCDEINGSDGDSNETNYETFFIYTRVQFSTYLLRLYSHVSTESGRTSHKDRFSQLTNQAEVFQRTLVHVVNENDSCGS